RRDAPDLLAAAECCCLDAVDCLHQFGQSPVVTRYQPAAQNHDACCTRSKPVADCSTAFRGESCLRNWGWYPGAPIGTMGNPALLCPRECVFPAFFSGSRRYRGVCMCGFSLAFGRLALRTLADWHHPWKTRRLFSMGITVRVVSSVERIKARA